MLGPPPSPNGLPPSGGAGFRRLRSWPVYVFGFVVFCIIGVLLYTFWQRAKYQRLAAERANEESAPAPASPILGPPEVHRTAYVPPKRADLAPQSQPAVPAAQPQADSKVPCDPKKIGDDFRVYVACAWQTYYQRLAKLDQDRWDQRLKAIRDPDDVVSVNAAGSAPASVPSSASALPAMPFSPLSGLSGLSGLASLGSGLSAAGAGDQLLAAQQRQERFINQTGDTGQHDISMAVRLPPPSPYAVMAGSYIPLVLETAVNSDSPGKFIARVSQDVDNTRNGACVIIPAGSKLIGKYDSEVGMGEDRLPGVVTRIVYPDTTSADLGAMEAADQSGAAGFNADVDNHLLKRLGNGLVVGIAGLGNYVGGLLPFGSGGVISGPSSAINSIGEFGLNIPPTLTDRPRTRFVAITGQDLILRPWSCNGRRFEPPLPIMTAE